MHGYKTVEVRSSEPRTMRGRCAVHFSRTYARAAYDEDKAYIVSNWKSGRIVERELPSYETLAKHAGEIVGVVEYEADAEDPCRWVLSNPVWLKRFIPIAGHPAMCFLPREVAADINRQLAEIKSKKGARATMDKEKYLSSKKKTEPTIKMCTNETMSEEEYRAFERDMARRAARQRKRAKQIQENEDSGKAHYVYRNERIYQFPYGIEASYPSGKYPIPEIAPDRRKRGRITSFTKKSKRRCRKALISLDLPNGATRYAVTLTLPWKIDDWGDAEVVADFNQAIETFRVSFARCFKHCAMIYRVEPQKSRAYHIHAMFYVPKDSTSWADGAYKYFEKMRKCKMQEVVDSGGTMPTHPDRCTTTDFLHEAFSLLWFNAIRRRISPESKIDAYWRVGVKVDVDLARLRAVQPPRQRPDGHSEEGCHVVVVPDISIKWLPRFLVAARGLRRV